MLVRPRRWWPSRREGANPPNPVGVRPPADWTGSAGSRTCRSAPAPPPCSRVEALPQVGRQRCRSRDTEAERRQLARPTRFGQAVVHGGHPEEHGALGHRIEGRPTSNRSKTTADAPAASVPKSPAHSPCTWKRGSARMRRSSGCQPQARRSACAPAKQRAVGMARHPWAARWFPRCTRSARRRRGVRRRARCGRRRRPRRRTEVIGVHQHIARGIGGPIHRPMLGPLTNAAAGCTSPTT